MPNIDITANPDASKAEPPTREAVKPPPDAAICLPRKIEIEALTQAESLILFASENAKDLPPPAVKAIADAWSARDTKRWDAETSASFWTAFHTLCALIKPATLDTLTSNQDNLARPAWQIWRSPKEKISLSKRTARRHFILLIVLLFTGILLQFVISTADTLSNELDKLLGEIDQLSKARSEELLVIASAVGEKQFVDLPDLKKEIASIQEKDNKLKLNTDQALYKRDLFTRVTTFGLIGKSFTYSGYNPINTIDGENTATVILMENRRDMSQSLADGSLTIKILKVTFLPFLLGTLGACAYVNRLISDEIKDTTFSSTSPTRHL